MEAILQLGIDLIVFLQSLGEWLLLPMKAFTFMGYEEFYLLVAPLIFWCIDAGLGLRVGLTLMVSNAFNAALKFVFHGPRPYWYSTEVQAYSAETSFGAPSGHAMNAAATWGRLAVGIQRKWFWIAAVVIIFLIGVSRLYLGVHFLHDVVLGWLFGALLVVGLMALEKQLTPRLAKMRATEQILWAFGASLALILTGSVVALLLSMSDWQLPASWISMAIQAAPDGEIPNPISLGGLISSAGTFFGLALGAILLFSRGGFEMRGPAWQLALRFLVGMTGLLVIYYGLSILFAGSEAMLAYLLRYIRYAALGAWVTAGAPFLFMRLKLAKPKLQ